MIDCCELCGTTVGATFRERFGHLRSAHRDYARSLVLRMVAPMVFLAGVLGLSAARAPRPAYLVALFACFGLLFFGKVRSRAERSRAGARPTLPLKRLWREGGAGLVLVVPVIVLVGLVAGR
jgi:hypothetical protein